MISIFKPFKALTHIGWLSHSRERETLAIITITLTILFVSFAIGAHLLESGCIMGILLSFSTNFLIYYTGPAKREKVWQFLARYAFWMDAGFTLMAVYFTLGTGVTMGIGFAMWGLINTAFLRLVISVKDPYHRWCW